MNTAQAFCKEVLGQATQNVNALRAKRPVHMRHALSIN
jgi:hypothetical protein